ncbi:MAG: NAD(P)/FAD-dependent oxidoreductase [Rhodospirillales bacterium]|nr:NAD(P)/FAD-dependent oxidoreductase [Rhodospirillales bacterium]
MSDKYDVIILGGGNAGLGVSAVAHEAGKRIAFVEQRDFGGTCPNRGCTPKKVLVAAGHALHEIETASAHHIEVSKPKLNWTKLIQREKGLISFIPDAMHDVAKKRGDVFWGSARFVGPNSVEVDGKVLEGDNIVIATGSKTRPLPIPGAELMITSDEVLSEEEQPGEVVFIGGGVIAMEFSHVYARAGTKVTILEVMPRLLPRVEAGAVAAIQAESERLGINVKTDVQVKAVAKSGDKLAVTYDLDGAEQTVKADRVINGAGRVANVETLDLNAGNVKHDRIAVETDEYLRSTSNPSVWVVGDALVTYPQLSPIATYEGRLVGENIVRGPAGPFVKPDYSVIPSGIYTVPALSTVGLSEEDAARQGVDVKVTTSDMSGWFSTKTYAESVAWSKVLVDESTDQIVGAHMVGHQSQELIHLFAMAMRHKIPASAIKNDMFAFPTFSSDLKSMF